MAGLEFNFNKTGIGTIGQLPTAQNFAEGQTKLKFTGMLRVTFIIQTYKSLLAIYILFEVICLLTGLHR